MKTADRDSLLRAQIAGLEGAWHALDSKPTYGQRFDVERRLLDLKRLAYLVPDDRGELPEASGYVSDFGRLTRGELPEAELAFQAAVDSFSPYREGGSN